VNVDQILQALNCVGVDYLLIGGMNFLLRHLPELTFDVDIWVRDDDKNLERLNGAIRSLDAQWGPTEREWAPVSVDWHWLKTQQLFCLTTKFGALDIFRDVAGLENQYDQCKLRAITGTTTTGVAYNGLSDEDMLTSQEILPPKEQKPKRIEVLRAAVRGRQRQ
jgi:hypothetical protein